MVQKDNRKCKAVDYSGIDIDSWQTVSVLCFREILTAFCDATIFVAAVGVHYIENNVEVVWNHDLVTCVFFNLNRDWFLTISDLAEWLKNILVVLNSQCLPLGYLLDL